MADRNQVATIAVYVGNDLTGDAMMKLPFLRALRRAFPEARITWISGLGRSVFAGWLKEVAVGLIDEVIEDVPIGRDWRELLRRPLPDRRFDLLIDTQNRLKITLILRRIRHERFISAAAGWRLSAGRPAQRLRHRRLTERMLDLVEAATGLPPDGSGSVIVPPARKEEAMALLPEDGRRYVGLAPGAGGRHKCWPLESYLELGRRLEQRGLTPVFLIGPQEQEWLPLIRAALPGALLPEQESASPGPLLTVALAGRLAAAVANDAGPGHLLGGGGVALVSLYGPTTAEKFLPVAGRNYAVRAQDYAADGAMAAIPVAAVEAAVLEAVG